MDAMKRTDAVAVVAPTPGLPDRPFAQQAVFDADLARMNKALRDGGWVHETPDGFTYVSPDAPEALVRAYRRLGQYGYANGLL